MSRRFVAVLVLITFIVAFGSVVAYGVGIGSAIKLFGIGWVVSKFGGQINSFINTGLGQRGITWEGTTKVVPILSIGRGGYIGAAQVAGPPDIVAQTQAVGQVETKIGGLGGRLLIPMSTKTPLKGVKKVKGVGVTAVIDFKM